MGLGGYPPTPTKEGCALSGLSRRAGSPSRGLGCDVRRVRRVATRFRLIDGPLLEKNA